MKNIITKYRKYIVISIIYLVVLLLLNYFILLILNLRYSGIIFYIFLYVALMYFTYLSSSGRVYIDRFNNIKFQSQSSFSRKVTMYLLTPFTVVLLLYSFISSPIFNAKKYQDLIKVDESGEFVNDFELTNINELPIVDHQYAMRLGDKVMGERFVNEEGLELNYGSEYEVREFYDIIYQGKPYLIAPLSYRGFFKWMSNRSGTPGYVLIEKSTGDRSLITNLEDSDLKMSYMPSAYFGKDLHRYVYNNGYKFNKLSKFYFEIDDDGNPYWVVVQTKYTIAINGGVDVNQVILVNAISGEIESYKPQEAPTWVENIYPKEIVLKQVDYWGSLESGYLNSVFAQKGVKYTTSGSRRIFNNEQLYHYTGLTSAGGDESSTGFVFINTKTKETKLYSIVGATEDAAMKSAEGQVNNFAGYYATFPVPLNINNQSTFFIAIKDGNGIIKKYTFVNITDYQKVGLGDSINASYSAYLDAIGEEEIIGEDDNLVEINGIIDRISWNIIDDKTVYYIKLEEDSSIYQVLTNISDELPLSLTGDNVSMSVAGSVVRIFDNDDIN